MFRSSQALSTDRPGPCERLRRHTMSAAPDEPGRMLPLLASAPRRRVLAQLRRGPQSLASLATQCELSTEQVDDELRVLRDAGLVQRQPGGRGSQATYEVHAASAQALDALLDEL